jgi:hypothetical protein
MKARSSVSLIATYRNTENAPVVFFDGPVAWALHDGVVAIELGIRAMVPVGQGLGDVGAETESHICGRLRCSPAAARLLGNAIAKTLEMIETPQDAAVPVVGKLN